VGGNYIEIGDANELEESKKISCVLIMRSFPCSQENSYSLRRSDDPNRNREEYSVRISRQESDRTPAFELESTCAPVHT
jgi:hypothetical protein